MSLHIQTNFPSGNACCADIRSTAERDIVYFSADPHGGTEALWFYLRIVECSDRPVDLVLTNIDSCLGGAKGWQSVRPVVRQAGGTWERLLPGHVEELDDGRHQVAWTIEPRYDSFEVALCFPYSLGDLEMTRAACRGYWELDLIGVTAQGQQLPRLANNYRGDEVPGLYLIARQHAGETPGSWVLDGLLRHAAQALDPSQLVIWTTPFAHLDGVVQGDYGKDPFPWDLNRAWTTPPMRHEVRVMQSDMTRWSQRCQPALVLDLHAPSPGEADGAYFFLPRETRPELQFEAARQAAEAIFPALPSALVHAHPSRQPNYPSRWDAEATLDNYAWDRWQTPSLAMEIPYSSSRETLFTREQYRRLGAALLEGICKWKDIKLG
jgi:hypothetical protein